MQFSVVGSIDYTTSIGAARKKKQAVSKGKTPAHEKHRREQIRHHFIGAGASFGFTGSVSASIGTLRYTVTGTFSTIVTTTHFVVVWAGSITSRFTNCFRQ
jgi:hypothetical protein